MPTQPVGPGGTPQGNNPSSSPAPASGYGNIDPLGIWQKFLSTPGHPATQEDVKLFLETMMKYYASLIAQENKKAIEALRKLKQKENEQ